MDDSQRKLFREALLDNIRQRGAKDVNQFIETLPERERKETLFPHASPTTRSPDGEQHSFWFLHEACQMEKFDTFTVFVNYSVKYGIDIAAKNTEGNSVLDIATLSGRIKFADYLDNRIGLSKLVPNKESFQRLVRLACQTGNQQMVEHWLCKMTEQLNRPLNAEDFVSGIDPVTEAFKGNHLDLACEIFKRNIVKITESMFIQTGSFLSERLHELIELVYNAEGDNEEHQVYRAQWYAKNIWYFDQSWLQTAKVQSSGLRCIDLSANHLEKVPEQLIWGLPQVQYLYLDNNELELVPAMSGYSADHIERSSLVELNLSNNKLQEIPVDVFRFPKMKILNLAHNYIRRLPYDMTTDGPQVYSERCRMLEKLDVSYNQLGTLPLWITKSTLNLLSLNICHNKMETLLPSWKCSLRELDASSNNISEMAVCDFHTHWAHSLVSLNLSKNELEEIPPTVCQLTLLNTLDLSRNEISQLPPENLWTTRHLITLNLSNNKLTCNYGDQESFTKKRESGPAFYADLVFPKVLYSCLERLYLGSNQLQSVPETVCEMRQLALLDLSGNQYLFKLPYRLCHLHNLFALRLDNTHISEPAEIVSLVSEPRELLQKLRETFENFQPFRQVKVVVAGPQSAGKTTLIRSLWGTEAPDDGLDTGKAIDIVDRRFKHDGLQSLQRSLSMHEESLEREIDFNVWDLKGGDSLELINRCCVTPNTVYLLVIDLNGDERELDKLIPWWLTIKHAASRSQVIIVGTNRNSTRRKENKMIQFLETLEEAIKHNFRTDINVFYIDIKTSKGQPKKCGFTHLQDALIKCVNRLSYNCRGSRYTFSKLMVPETFLLLKERISIEIACMQGQPDLPRILTEADIHTLASEIPNSSLNNEDDLQEVLEFLNYTGSYIHVSDRKYGLGRLYFPDPSWLCDVVKSVTELQQTDLKVSGKISKEHLRRLCKNTGFGNKKFKEFEQLLKSFEIIMPSAEDNNTYWLPCKLPSEKPAMEFMYHGRHGGPEPKQLRRVYKLPYIPPGFWIHLVSRIINSVEMRKRNRTLHKPRSRTLSGSGSLVRAQSISGDIGRGNGTNVYWQTGILVFHETGDLLVEDLAASYTTSFPNDEDKKGVCITVKCRLGRFSIMGLIVDEVESLISNWYPDLAYSEMYRLVPCPICEEQLSYRERSDSGRRSSDSARIVRAHLFSVEDLGTKVCKAGDESVQCPNHEEKRVLLISVIPEMFLEDLNVRILSQDKFQFHLKKKFKLGSGGFGDVYKGKYDGKTVAIKCFSKESKPHASSIPSSFEKIARTDTVKVGASEMNRKGTQSKKISSFRRRLSSIGDWRKSSGNIPEPSVAHTVAPVLRQVPESNGGLAEKHSHSASGSNSGTYDPEVIASFTKLRNELVVMCRLHHPYIVALIGACLQPLCFAMEFAPYGDLSALLQEKYDATMAKLPLGQHVELQGTMIGRQLSFKIAYQIAVGLTYLHDKDITHADLKPANVLVFSKDVNDPVNVKITDYGISRNVDHSGNKGRVGTQGFQAPEIGHGLIFDKEADWFSYGRLLYQVFTGVPPSHYLQKDSKIKQVDEEAGNSRFPFVRYTLQTSFPLFIALMRACWRENPQERPRNSRISAVLQDRSILALRHVIQLGPFKCICPIVATSTNDDKVHTWTGGVLKERRRYQVISSDHGKPFAKAELNMGMPVQCVVQVGKYNVIGTTSHEMLGFECPNDGNPTTIERTRMFSVPASVVTLHYQQSVFDEIGLLFAGLKNGTTVVYQVQPHDSIEEWTLKSTLQLGDPTMSCACFHSVRNGREVWAACGNTLRIINTLEMTVAPGIIEVNNNGRKADVACLTGTQNSIWCSLKGSDEVMEYSTKSRELVNKISLQSKSDDSEITSLLVVKDTIWMGKNTGDIVVVSIGEGLQAETGKPREVAALGVLSLHPMLDKPNGCISQILKSGQDRILACHKYQQGNGELGIKDMTGFLSVWESWGSDDFQRFQMLQSVDQDGIDKCT